MPTRGLRGATTVESDTRENVLDATKELLEALLRANPSLRTDDIASALFTVTDEAEDWSGHIGKIDTDLIREAGINPEALYFICGSPEMIHYIVDILRGLGIRRKQMRYELWW